MIKHVLSVSQFEDKTLLKQILKEADRLQALPLSKYPKVLENLTLATLFYEPSTRTRISFETAIQNLGGRIVSTENAAGFSSAAKGETIEDSIRVIQNFAQGIVIRHPEAGSAERAASVANVPIINGGDGIHEHPTQGLLDIYTIYRLKGLDHMLHVGLVGDLLYGRTAHSLILLLMRYKVEFYFISPPSLKLPQDIIAELDKHGIRYHITADWHDVLPKLDVLYMTRVQKERFKREQDYLKVKDDFILTPKEVSHMKKDAAILHPLPRINEITPAVDNDPRAQYFQQVKNGLFLRMSLLEYIYGK